ncbi:MAG: hypothetical protein NTZ24_14745, partial [Deltaproteobacteria bacterium]|nr:hypothetical protein [Deltaproteobacteria bacterium]
SINDYWLQHCICTLSQKLPDYLTHLIYGLQNHYDFLSKQPCGLSLGSANLIFALFIFISSLY